MATKGRGGASSVANYVAEAQARRQKFADGGVPRRSLLGRASDSMSRSIGDSLDSLRANTTFENATSRGVREMSANNGLGLNPIKRDNFANGMDGVQTRQQQLEQLERNNLPPVQAPPTPVSEKPALQASEIRFSNGTAYVNGPGTGTSDSIPARLSKGEAVLPAKTVKTLGVDTVADLIEATNGKKPNTIGDTVRAKFADGGVPAPKKLGGVQVGNSPIYEPDLTNPRPTRVSGVQVANTPAYEIPANPKPNVNTDFAKGGTTFVSEAPTPKTTSNVEKPAFMRATAAGKVIPGIAELSDANPALRSVGSSPAAAGTAATQAGGATTQPVANAVEATKSAAKGVGSTVKGWWSNGVDAGKKAVDIAKGGIAAGKDAIKPPNSLSPKAGVIGGLISGGLSAYGDLAAGKPLGETLGKAATRTAFGAGGAVVGSLGGPFGSAAAGVFADRVGEMAANYYFGDPNDNLKDHAVTKFLEDGKNMGRTRTPFTTQGLAPVAPQGQQPVPAQTQTAASVAPSQPKALDATVQGVSPVNISEGVNRYDLGNGQSPLYTNLGAGANEAFLSARKQALNSDPGWQPPRQPELPSVDDTTPAGMAENDLRDQARIANERSDYRNQGLAQRAAENKRSMQNQYAYEQMPEGTDSRTLGIMAYRDNLAREQAQNAAVARANDPRNMLLNQIQSKIAGGGQLTKAGVAALHGLMGDDSHRYATRVGADSHRYAADSSAASSKYHADAGMSTAYMNDQTQRRGQDITTDNNRLMNELAQSRLTHDKNQQRISRSQEGSKMLDKLLEKSPHVIGVAKDGTAAVDAKKFADFASWLHTQTGGVDADGRPQSLSATMMGMSPDEATSALAAANDAYTVRNVFKQRATDNGLHHTAIGNGVPEFTVGDMELSDPMRRQAGWLSSLRSSIDPRVSGKVIRMKNAHGGEVSVPMGSLTAEEQAAFVNHAQVQAKQRGAPDKQ